MAPCEQRRAEALQCKGLQEMQGKGLGEGGGVCRAASCLCAARNPGRLSVSRGLRDWLMLALLSTSSQILLGPWRLAWALKNIRSVFLVLSPSAAAAAVVMHKLRRGETCLKLQPLDRWWGREGSAAWSGGLG